VVWGVWFGVGNCVMSRYLLFVCFHDNSFHFLWMSYLLIKFSRFKKKIDTYMHPYICLFFASLEWFWVVNMYLSLWLIYSSKIILGIKYKIREIKNNINFQHINQWWVSIFIKKQTNNLYIESIFFFQDLISPYFPVKDFVCK
jgi:hypothetical protein